jgi:hypothetical protein
VEVLKQRVSASRSSFITTRPSAMTIATSEPRAGHPQFEGFEVRQTVRRGEDARSLRLMVLLVENSEARNVRRCIKRTVSRL